MEIWDHLTGGISLFTVQEMIEQFAEEYSLFAEQDARFLTIHSVSQYLDFFSANKIDCLGQKRKCLRGHAAIGPVDRFLKAWKDGEPSLWPETFLLTTEKMEAETIKKLQELHTRLEARAIVLMQTKLKAEEMYLILLEKISRQNRETKKFISKDLFRLTELLNNGADIKEIEKAARKILGNPMIITDESYKVLAYSEDASMTDPIWKTIVSHTYCPSNLVKLTDYNHFWKRLKAAKRPLFVDSEAFSPYIRRAVAEIRVKGKTKGYIALLERDKTIAERDLDVLQMVADLIGIKLREMDEISLVKGQMEREFLSDLFSGTMKSEKMAQNRAESLGWKLCDYYLVICAQQESKTLEDLKTVFLKLRHLLRERFPLCVFRHHNNLAYFLLGSSTKSDLVMWANKRIETFLEREKIICYAGKPCQSLINVSASCRQAADSLKVMGMFDEVLLKKRLYSFSETAVFLMLSRLNGSDGQNPAVSPSLWKLVETDKTEGTEYVQTLRHFFLNNQSVSATAKSMFLHRNTILYRLNKIKELLEDDFDHPAVRLHLQISLILYDMGVVSSD